MLDSFWKKTSKGVWVRAEYLREKGIIRMGYQRRIALSQSGRLVEFGPENQELAPVDTLRGTVVEPWCNTAEIQVDTPEFAQLLRRVRQAKLDAGELYKRVCVHAVTLGMEFGEELGDTLKWFDTPMSKSWLPDEDHEYTGVGGSYEGVELIVHGGAKPFDECWSSGVSVELEGVECDISLLELLYWFTPDCG